MPTPPFDLRDPFLIEGSRLMRQLDNAEVQQRLTAGAQRLEQLDSDNPEWGEVQEQLRQLEQEFQQNEDTIGLLHWVLNRNSVADVPAAGELSRARAHGLYAGPVACLVPRSGGLHNQPLLAFTDYDTFTVSKAGQLMATGTRDTPGPRNAKTFRHALLPVPFHQVEVLSVGRTNLLLKIVA